VRLFSPILGHKGHHHGFRVDKAIGEPEILIILNLVLDHSSFLQPDSDLAGLSEQKGYDYWKKSA
jgi:hypothetical protein